MLMPSFRHPLNARARFALGGLLVAGVVLAGALSGCTPDASGQASTSTGTRAPDHLVELATVDERTLRAASTYTGSLRYRTVVRVFSQEEGRLERLPWYEGDLIPAGGTLFELDASLLRAQHQRATAVLDEATANLKRTKRLLERRMISDEESLRAETAVEVARAEQSVLSTRLGFTREAAPFDAVVTARLAEPGDIVARHSHLLTIADPTSLVTELEVSELVIPHLVRGAEVEVRIDALGDRTFAGVIQRIHPELNARTRQGRVEVTLSPVPEGARAGLFTRVTFRIAALQRKVMPFAALRRDNAGEYVFRVDADGLARRVEVRGGRRGSDLVEVIEGLSAGDRVVTKGFLGLAEGKAVTPVAGTRAARAGPAPGEAPRERG
jgi:RND family efflux transporter MFP subunit